MRQTVDEKAPRHARKAAWANPSSRSANAWRRYTRAWGKCRCHGHGAWAISSASLPTSKRAEHGAKCSSNRYLSRHSRPNNTRKISGPATAAGECRIRDSPARSGRDDPRLATDRRQVSESRITSVSPKRKERSDEVAAKRSLRATRRTSARVLRAGHLPKVSSTRHGPQTFAILFSARRRSLRRSHPAPISGGGTPGRKNIAWMIAGPTTLWALLTSLHQIGFKTLQIQKRSSEVWNLLASVKN